MKNFNLFSNKHFHFAAVLCLLTLVISNVTGADLTIDLNTGSSNVFSLSTSSANDASTEITKSSGGYSYKLKAADACYYYSSKALFIGKSGSYIKFPAVSGKKLTKVTIYNCAGASSKGTVSICPAGSSTPVSGGTASTISAGSYTTWTLSGTSANTSYQMYINNGYNVQVTRWILEYTNAGTNYTLVFKDPSGTKNGDDGSVSANATSFTLGSTKPSKTGHHLIGFYKESSLTNLIADTARTGATVTGGKFRASTAYTNSSKQYTETAGHDLYLKWEADSYAVTSTLTNCSASSTIPSSVSYTGSGLGWSYTITPSDGYALPSSITLTMGGVAMTSGTDYTWNSSTGALTVSKVITGPIVLTITANRLYTITFNDNGSTTNYVWQNGSVHATPSIVACDEQYDVLGWTTTAPTSNAWATQPSYTAAGGNITVSGDATYYAVYTTEGTTPTNKFKRVTSSSDLISGEKYVITNTAETYAIACNTFYTDKSFPTVSVSPSSGIITTDADKLIYAITGNNTSGYSIYSEEDGGTGIGYDNSEGVLAWYSSGPAHWLITVGESNAVYIQAKKATTKYLQYSSSYYWLLTTETANHLFRQMYNTLYVSNPTCCDKPTALTNGSITASSQTVSWTDAGDAEGGYYVAYSTATSDNPGADVYSTSGNYTVIAVAAGTKTANIPCSTAGTYNWWVRSKCSTGADNSSCSGWVKGTAWTMSTIYLKTNATWRADNAYYAVYFWDATTNGWTPAMSSQTDCETGVYKVTYPAAYTSMKFCRMNPAYATPAFGDGHVWNETGNLTIPANKDCFTIPGSDGSGTGNGEGNANWSVYARKYQIDFDLNKPSVFTSDPSTAPDARCVATGSTTAAPTNAQAMGKEITGWYKEAGCSNEWVFASQQVSGDQTLYAKWEDVSDKTIYLDCSATLSGSKTWDADETVLFAHAYINGSSSLYTDVKMGSAVSSCDNHVYAFTIPGNATHVSFARCKKGTSVLPAEWGGGDPVFNAITGKAVASGKDWYKVTDWGSADLDNSPFAATTYTISYNKGSATYAGGNTIDGSKSNETKNCDIAFTLPSSAVFSAEGYTQTSWATSDGGSSAYDLGGSYTTNAAQAFYPVWTINSHTLTWNWGDGSCSATAGTDYTAGGTVNYGAAITYPGNGTMSRTGYNFSSWSSSLGTMPDNDLTITAQWTIHTHKVSVASVDNATITATPAGGSAIAEGSNNASVDYNKTVTLGFTADTHYSGITWDVYKDGDSSTKVAVSGSGNGATFTLPDYDVIVSATAVEDAYKTVCFKNNGVGITGYTTQKVYVGERPSAPTLTDGYSTGDACDETSDKHYGWTQETWDNTIADKSTLDARTGNQAVYAKSANLPIVAAEDPSTIYYHAVWAEGSAAPAITLPTPRVAWNKQSFSSGSGVSANSGTGTMTTNINLSSEGICTYSGSVTSGIKPLITLSGLSLSSYSNIKLSFYARSSQSAGIKVSYSTNNGSSYTDLSTTSNLSSIEKCIEVSNIPASATNLKLEFQNSTQGASFFFGTVRIYEGSTTEYTFTELTSSNTSGWSNSDWDGDYIITYSTTPSTCLNGWLVNANSIGTVSPSDGKITISGHSAGMAYHIEYSAGNSGFSVKGIGANSYMTSAHNTLGYSSDAVYHKGMAYNSITSVVNSTDYTLQWGSASKCAFYNSNQTKITLYKTLSTASNFRTTCCTQLGEPETLELAKTAYTITATWTATSGGHEDGYSVQLYNSSSEAIGDPVEIDCSSECDLEHEFTSLSANTTYYVGVTPTNSAGGGYCATGTEKKVSVTTNRVYQVTYDGNGKTGGTVPTDANYYEAGDEVTVAANPLTRSGYTNNGWNTANDGSGNPYAGSGSATMTMPADNVTLYAAWIGKKNYYIDRMHGNCDGVNTVEVAGVVYNCFLREAQHTTPDLSDNSTGSNTCVSGHEHFIGWVIDSKIGAQGQLLVGYTIIKGGVSNTAVTDGTVYWAVWAEDEE